MVVECAGAEVEENVWTRELSGHVQRGLAAAVALLEVHICLLHQPFDNGKVAMAHSLVEHSVAILSRLTLFQVRFELGYELRG